MSFKYLIILFILPLSISAKVNIADIAKNYSQKNLSSLNAVAISVGVIHRQKIVFHHFKGKRNIEKNLNVNQSTLFRIGSMTKTITATAIMILRERNLIKLDDPAEIYIHELKEITYPFIDSPKITIRHLLTHTSGLVRYISPKNIKIDDLIAATIAPASGSIFIKNETHGQFYPGFKYQYSNLAFALLGEIIARVSKRSVANFIKYEILLPLKMQHTFWSEADLPEHQRSFSYELNQKQQWVIKKDWDLQGYSSAGSLYSTLPDMSKWMQFQFKTKPSDKSKILSPFVISEMHKIQTLNNDQWNIGTGITWFTQKGTVFTQTGHNGKTGGYRFSMLIDKNEQLGVVVMASSGLTDVENFGQKLLTNIQFALAEDRSHKFRPIALKLIPYLNLETKNDYHLIFDQALLNYANNTATWVLILKNLLIKNGKILNIDYIQSIGKNSAIIQFKTSKGISKYQVTFSNSEKGKLAGLLNL